MLGVPLFIDLVVGAELLLEIEVDFEELFFSDFVLKGKKLFEESAGAFQELQEESPVLEDLNPALLGWSEEGTELHEIEVRLKEVLVEVLHQVPAFPRVDFELRPKISQDFVEEEAHVVVGPLLDLQLLERHYLFEEKIEILLKGLFELLLQVSPVEVDLQRRVLVQF